MTWIIDNLWWLAPVGLILGVGVDHWINGPDHDQNDCTDMYP